MTAPLTDEECRAALDLYTKCGTYAEAQRRSGIHVNTIKNRVIEAKRRQINPSATLEHGNLLKINESLRDENERLKRELAQAIRPHFTIRQDNAKRTETIRVVCIGDAHDSPEIPDKSRFEWIGKYIKKEKPDVVIQIGDFMTLDSLNTHVPNDTYDGRSKKTFRDDLESFNLALQALDCFSGPERHVTLGNHERRLYLFEQRAPEAYGMMQVDMGRMFERYKWTFSAYGMITYYGGVGFTHAALNRLGKTYGGKNAEQTIANDCLHDLVIGHSHVDRKHRASKIGTGKHITILNTGCALPEGHIEDYATHSATGWSYGICDLRIQHGHIRDNHFVTMARLEELFG